MIQTQEPQTGPSLRIAERQPMSQWRRTAGIFFRTPLAPFGLALVLLAIGAAASAFLIAPYHPNEADFTNVLGAPSRSHLLGTDDIGRDILSRIMHGSVISLQVGFGAPIISTVLGVGMGIVAGYYGGWIDEALMRVTDALLAFPSLILALTIAATLGPSVGSILIAIAITSFSGMARLSRGNTLAVKELEFIEASKAIGATDLRTILSHVLPNSLSPVIIHFTLMVSAAILIEASLSFLGVGVRPPQASWGGMLHAGYRYLEQAPWMSIVPGMMIFLTVLGFNLVGDGLRAAMDPRLRDIRVG